MRNVVRRCPVCGARGHACGPRTTVLGVDPGTAPRKDTEMGPLRRYNVVLYGMPTTMNLTENDAARLGGTPVEEPAPAVEDTAELPPPKARRSTANKARTARDKSGG